MPSWVLLPLLEWKRFLDERREVAGAERNHLVVEIVVRIVQQAAALHSALAQEHVGAGAFLQHVREVLAAHGRLVLGDDVVGAEKPLADLGGERGFARAVHGGGIATRIGYFGRGAE